MNSEYAFRINQTIDFIEKNFQKQLTLEELAEVACFSRFHFNRIFYSQVKETPFQFINRIRLEKAAYIISSNPAANFSEVAHYCGFNELAVFSRNFKKFFHMSPTQYRKTRNSNISQTDSNNYQVEDSSATYFCSCNNLNERSYNMELNKGVTITQFSPMHVAYIRHIGPYQGDENLFERLWNELFNWAGPRDLLNGNDFKALVIYHDDPNLTDEDKLRMSVCITIPEATKVSGKVGKMALEGGKYAVARFELTAQDFGKAWNWIYAEWLPASGYQPDDKPAFEMYPEEPKDGKFIVDICIPVKPL